MSAATMALAVAALLGAAVVGGVFFAFSSFVMSALARVPSAEGIAAMQSINVVVINPSFLGGFLGTAAVCAGLAALAVLGWGGPSSAWYLAGALAYLIGTFGVTMFGNVPLNNQLAAAAAADPATVPLWQHYLDRWTALNTARTVAALGAAALLLVGLLRG